MQKSKLEKAYSLLQEKYGRHEKILIQAYKSLKKKEQELLDLNNDLEARKEELHAMNHELRVTNEELKAANEAIKQHNENLDDLVKQRSKKIEEQLALFNQYAYLNAHNVRGPLARILGLVRLLNYDTNKDQTPHIIEKLHESAQELDQIVSSMNRLLEQGEFPIPDNIEIRKGR